MPPTAVPGSADAIADGTSDRANDPTGRILADDDRLVHSFADLHELAGEGDAHGHRRSPRRARVRRLRRARYLDGTAGLWCVNVGHGRPEIIEAVREQLETLDYFPTFYQYTHPAAATLARKGHRSRARAPEQRVLRQLRLGRERHRGAGAALPLQPARQAAQEEDPVAHRRLPRLHPPLHRDDDAGLPHRLGLRRRARALPRVPVPLPPSRRHGRGRVLRFPDRRHAPRHREDRRRAHRGLHRRARAGRGRRHGAAGRLPPPRRGAVPRVRDPDRSATRS